MKPLFLLFILSILFSQNASFAQENIKVLEPSEISEGYNRLNYGDYTIDYHQFMDITHREGQDFVLLDLRSKAAFDHQHIKGAVHFGADVDEKKLKALIPSKDTKIILYCTNTLMPTRLMSLTHVALPQFHMLGYKNTYMVDRLWVNTGDGLLYDGIEMVGPADAPEE